MQSALRVAKARPATLPHELTRLSPSHVWVPRRHETAPVETALTIAVAARASARFRANDASLSLPATVAAPPGTVALILALHLPSLTVARSLESSGRVPPTMDGGRQEVEGEAKQLSLTARVSCLASLPPSVPRPWSAMAMSSARVHRYT
jgi:hypothetical protein